jgi:hypothetical protein
MIGAMYLSVSSILIFAYASIYIKTQTICMKQLLPPFTEQIRNKCLLINKFESSLMDIYFSSNLCFYHRTCDPAVGRKSIYVAKHKVKKLLHGLPALTPWLVQTDYSKLTPYKLTPPFVAVYMLFADGSLFFCRLIVLAFFYSFIFVNAFL